MCGWGQSFIFHHGGGAIFENWNRYVCVWGGGGGGGQKVCLPIL